MITIHWEIFILNRWWINTSTWTCLEKSVEVYKENSQWCKTVVIGFDTMTMLSMTPSILFSCVQQVWLKNKTTVICHPSHCKSYLWDFFLFPCMKKRTQTKVILYSGRSQRKNAVGLRQHSSSGFPKVLVTGELLRRVHSVTWGILWNRLKFQ